MVRHLVKKVELISVFPTNYLSPQFFSCVHPFCVLRSSDPVYEVYLVSSVVGVDVENLWWKLLSTYANI